jgi:hypothetical protein
MNGNFYFRYSRSVPKEYPLGTLQGANLAYVNVPELDPSGDAGNLRIIDRSYSGFPENGVLFANSIISYPAGTGNIINDSYNFLITSEYGNATPNDGNTLVALNPTIPIRPLWYIHRFGTDYIPDKPPSGAYNIRIYDKNGDLVPDDHYKFDSTVSPVSLYTDLINTLDETYTLVYMSNRDEVRRLLSVEPLYTKVDTEILDDNEYTLVANPGGDNRWLIVVPDSGIEYSIKNIGTTKIYVKHPVQVTSQTDPWYVQITNGYFKRIQDGNVYEYFLPEYSSQSWKPLYPYKLQALEKPTFIDNDMLRLKQTPLAKFNDTDELRNIRIYIRRSIDRTIHDPSTTSNDVNAIINSAGLNTSTAVATTALSQTAPDWASIGWQELDIEDIDRNSGLVRIAGLKGTMPDGSAFNEKDNAIYTTDEIVACYYYIEEEYTFNKINFNPLANKAILGGGISIYLKPAKAYGYPGIVGSSLEDLSFTLPSTVEWIRFDADENIVDSSNGLSVTGTTIDAFYQAYKANNLPQEGDDQTKFVELARIFLSPSSSIRDITDENLVDTRILGGGLINPLPQDSVDLIEANTYGMYRFRNWDGATFPGNSVVIIQLPIEKLTSLTTKTPETIQSTMRDLVTTCKKHIAAGVMPIVRFYDHTTGQIVDTILDDNGEVVSAHPPLDRNYF